jgi:PAS domain S-box-containing protein
MKKSLKKRECYSVSIAKKVREFSQFDGVKSAFERYELLFSGSSEGIAICNRNFEFIECNPAFEKVSGYRREELIGLRMNSLCPEKNEELKAFRSKRFSLDFLESSGLYEDVLIRKKGGVSLSVDCRTVALEDQGEKVWALFIRDISEKKEIETRSLEEHKKLNQMHQELHKAHLELKGMQETLISAGKMVALGELSAGIAHELNQPLLAIKGYAQETLSVLDPMIAQQEKKEVVLDYLKEIDQGVDRMSSIIRHLRNFVRASSEEYDWVDLSQTIESSLKVLEKQFQQKNISIHRSFSSKSIRLYANSTQLEQVVINLCANARDAIIETGRGSGKISVKTSLKDEFVEVEFEDDGCGMDERTRKRAFNPFFTTKEVGKGMGLGLSLSYGFIEKLQGNLVIESVPGKGSRFLIRVPVDFRELG